MRPGASATAWSFLRSGPAASVAVGMVSAILAMALSTLVVRGPVAPDHLVEIVWVSTYFVLIMGVVRIRFLNGPLLAHAR